MRITNRRLGRARPLFVDGSVSAALRHGARLSRALLPHLVALSVFQASAAEPPPQAGRSTVSALRSEVVRPGLYRFDAGAGASSLLRLGSTGLIAVDAHRVAAHDELMGEFRRIARGTVPAVAALLLTAASHDQTRHLLQFAEAGMQVVGQRRALASLPPEARAGQAAASRPFIAYDSDYQLSIGDIQAEAEHVGSGRTGADSVVFFRDLRVLAVGELYTHGTPRPDCASGGSYAGWAAAIAHLLYFDFDVAVPSSGAVVGKPELQALKAKLDALAAAVGSSAAVASGC